MDLPVQEVYAEYLNDNKGKIKETSKIIHKAMNIASKKVAYAIERKCSSSPTSVMDAEMVKIGNYFASASVN